MQKNIYGKASEIIAADFLKEKGYKILETNYKNKIGEIDVIALYGDYIVFVEVKARSSLKFGHPFEAIDKRKQQKIKMIASLYLTTKRKTNTKCRFDAIALLGQSDYQITHIKDCF